MGAMAGPVAAIADAFAAGVHAEGLTPDPRLRLLRHVVGGAQAPASGPEVLGPMHERLLNEQERTSKGAWYTPAWLAEQLVTLALPDRAALERGTVLDPACGGGAFLLAAARRACALGESPAEAVRRLRGRDVDPVAVAVTEAALWWWSARQGTPVLPGRHLAVDDALTGAGWGRHAAVVGNPPFLGQLRTATAVGTGRRERLRQRFGPAVRAYTDPAWLFLVAAIDAVADGGRVVLVQPQSLLAARDAAAVRAHVDDRAALVHTVVDDGTAFAAAVSVCAPVLERTVGGASGYANDWVAALADAQGVPRVELGDGTVLADVADVHAGFRDEYYGLVDAVSDGTQGRSLVTAGAIDPFRVLVRPQRFAGRRWNAPVVDVAALEGRAARWVEVQRGPKVLVATQTRVLEAVADPEGALVGSVPVLCVRPHDPEMLWHVLAMLQAPAASAWLLRRSAGTALSAGACRPTSALLGALPLPGWRAAWDRAACAARGAAAGSGEVGDFAAAADEAYGVHDDAVRRWWYERLPAR